MSEEFNPTALLHVLSEHKVQFVVIGGLAAWVQGAPIVTTDVDIVYLATDENVAALVEALQDLNAYYRQRADKLVPVASALSATTAAGHHLLRTKHGDLDVLRTAAEHCYEDLCDQAVLFDIAGSRCLFASLAQIIELKEAAGRPKDLMALPAIRAALKDQE